MNEFLSSQGWVLQQKLDEDGSPRVHSRVAKGMQTAILVEYKDPDFPGHKLHDFVRIADWLRAAGLRAPEIYEEDEKAGFLLVEDFGDLSMKRAMEQGQEDAVLYRRASEILKILNEHMTPHLPDYFDSPVHKGHRRVMDWYVPAVRQEQNPDALTESYLAAWERIEKTLPDCPQGFLHMDYHAENLMVLPDGALGILDFQGAMVGPLPYDLGNLLEDARVDVDPVLREDILLEFDEDFRAWYRVLTTQFHCRVIGQFIKMAVEQGKDGYLPYIPRLQAYIQKALRDPLLAPLKEFFEAENIDFSQIKTFHADEIRAYIRTDAY